MKRFSRLLILSATILVTTSPALSQTTAMINRMIDSRFASSDTNKDGKLTKAEAKAGGMDRVVANFDRLDAKKRGYVSKPQIKAMAAKR
ncbi:MAG: hypothetical protein ABJN65_04525 [Parasphingorhabdus sp.]